MLQAAGGMGSGIITYLVDNDRHDHNRTVFVYTWLIGDVVADVLIATIMTYLVCGIFLSPAVMITDLYFQLLRATHKQQNQTSDIVKRIVRLTIETNTLSSVVAIVSLILIFRAPNTTYFICPTIVLSKLCALLLQPPCS
jgi:hypothetical protein